MQLTGLRPGMSGAIVGHSARAKRLQGPQHPSADAPVRHTAERRYHTRLRVELLQEKGPMSEDLPEDKSTELLLEQYKLYVEMADRVSARRTDASKLYISLLTGLLVVIPLVLEQGTPVDMQNIAFLAMGFLGLALCSVWILNIRSYKQLNSLKFKVIHEMEQKLPFPCYDREWEILREEKESRSYLRLSKIEQYVPLLLMIPYLILLIYTFLHL